MKSQISFLDIFRSIGSFRIKFLKTFDYTLGGLTAFLLPPLPNKDLPHKFKKILVIRPGGAGDAVFLLPILKILGNQGFVVDVLCEKRNAEIFTSQSHLLNEIYLYEKEIFEVLRKSYDIVVDTEQWHYLSAIVGYFIKSEYKIGFVTRPLRAKLFHKRVQYNENGYELDDFKRLFEGILPAEIRVVDINNCFDVPFDKNAWASEQMPDRSVSVFLGASVSMRRLTLEQLLIVIHELLDKNYIPVLLGGKDVVVMSRQVIKNIKDQRVKDFVGKTSLLESAALIQRSGKFIGTDSGLMHLACAVGTPVIAFFGPSNKNKWGPKGSEHKIITENVSCSPCARFGYTLPTCWGSYHCMKKLKLEKIL